MNRKMNQSIVILLEKDQKLEKIRAKYLPKEHRFEPHITLVYPFKDVEQEKLHKHITGAVNQIGPFELSLHGLKKSTYDYYVYLLVDKGKDELEKLYNLLNKGILSGFKNKYMPHFIPHVTVGILENEQERGEVMEEIEEQKINLKIKAESIQLITFDEKHSLKKVEDFSLMNS